MPARIQELIAPSARDNFRVILDQIGAILKVESEGQQALAAAAHRNPRDWAIRVYTERSNPWDEFPQPEGCEDHLDPVPIVNVSLDNMSYDGMASNAVSRQRCTGTYHIDCYGFGVSADVPVGGHSPGDWLAADAAQRALQIVRNIIMSSYYTYLGMRGVVGKRWPQSVTMFQPQIDNRVVEHVVAVRMSLAVEFNEFSPQYQGEPLELLSTEVRRSSTGELLFGADFPATS